MLCCGIASPAFATQHLTHHSGPSRTIILTIITTLRGPRSLRVRGLSE